MNKKLTALLVIACGLSLSIGGFKLLGQAASTFTISNLAQIQWTGSTVTGPCVWYPTGTSISMPCVSLVSIATSANCSSSASPAVCGSAPAGSVNIVNATTTEVVNDSAVTANSQILLQFDASLGTKLGVTCNTTLAPPQVTARTAGTSFTIGTASAPTTNPACYSFEIVN